MIRTALIFFFAAIIGIVVQSTVVHSSFPSVAAPDVILILTVVLGMRYRSVAGLFSAFLLGILADFASGQYVGPNAAGNIVAFLAVGSIASRVYAERVLAVAMITFMCSILKSLVLIALLALYVKTDIIGVNLLNIVVLEALFSGVLSPLVMKLIGHSRGANVAVSSASSFRWSTESR
jgi:rod shape-determining protein MreD